MLAQDIIYLMGDIVLLTAIPALALFVGFYYFGSPWRTLLVGRSLMYFAVSLLAIILVVALSVWLGPTYPLREWVRFISYVLVSVTTWRLRFTGSWMIGCSPNPISSTSLTPCFWMWRSVKNSRQVVTLTST